jgi:hypothetical protein
VTCPTADLLGTAGPCSASQRLIAPNSCFLFADFNENGFIDEEDLQKIVLRLMNSDDVSEDLLMDLTHHVCTWGLKGRAEGPDHHQIP